METGGPVRSPSPHRQSATEPRPTRAACETYLRLAIEPTPEEIFRCLGYPPSKSPSPPTAAAIRRVMTEARRHLRPRGMFALYPISSQTARSVTINGVVIHGQIGEYLHGADRLAVVLATAGREITEFGDFRCRAGDTFGGWVADAVGSWAAEAAADALLECLRARLGDDESLTLRYSPGYCGMDLGQQRALFRLLRAEPLGVRLEDSLLMNPLKSVSGIVGLGPRAAVGINLSPCDRCPLLGCHLRR